MQKEVRRKFTGLVVYITLNIWKERNRIVFQNQLLNSQQVVSKIRENIEQRERAFQE